MKTKIFALIAAMLCIGMLLVSCGEEVADNTCTSHVDENKDKKCDLCAVDYIAPCNQVIDADNDGKCDYCGHEATLPEEDVPVMVVKPIPDDADEYAHFDFTYKDGVIAIDQQDTIAGAIVANGAAPGAKGGRIIVFKHSAEQTTDATNPDATAPTEPVEDPWMKDYYSIYDLVTKKTIWSFQTEKYNNEYPLNETYSFELSEYFFGIMKTKVQYNSNNPFDTPVTTYTYTYRTNAGDAITVTNSIANYDEEKIGDVFYLTVNDLVYPIDTITSKRLTLAGETEPYIGNVDTFVKRPAFDCVLNDLGYVFERDINGNVVAFQVYDLNEWVDCIYSYIAPSYVAKAYTKIGVLQNSTVLLETLVPLANNSKAFDIIENNQKYDIVYTIINPIDSSVKEVEFGYYIDFVSETSDATVITDTTVSPNLAYIYPIVDDMIDFSEVMTVVLDNDLNIICMLEKDLPAQIDAQKTPVGNDLYIVVLNIGGKEVKAVIDKAGNLKNYLPDSCYCGDGFIIAGSKIYTYDMREKFNLRTLDGEYEIVVKNRGFLILAKPNIGDSQLKDYFYFNPADASQPALIASESFSTSNKVYVGTLGSSLFLIREDFRLSTDPSSEIISRYYVFNSDNFEAGDFNEELFFVGEYENTTLVSDGTLHYLFFK